MSVSVKWFDDPIQFNPISGTTNFTTIASGGEETLPNNATFVILYICGDDDDTDRVYWYKVDGSHTGRDPSIRAGSLQTALIPVVNGQAICVVDGIREVYLAGYGYGGTWASAKTDVTPVATGSWAEFDISSKFPGADFVCLEGYSVHGNILHVRKKGSTDDLKYVLYPHVWMYTGLDANAIGECYRTGSGESIYAYGAFISGEGQHINTNWPQLAISSTGWQEYDASSGIQAGHKTALLYIKSDGAATYGVRKKGGSFAVTGVCAIAIAFALVELDSDGKFEANFSTTDCTMYVIGSLPEAASPQEYPDSGLTRVTALRHLYRPGQYKLFANLGFVSQKVEYVEYTPPAMEPDEPPIDVIIQPPEPVYPPYEPGPYLPPYPDPDAFPPYEPGITSEPQWTGRYGPGYVGSVVNGRLELPKGTSELINNLILNDINNERITQTGSRKLGWEEPSSMVSKVWQGITPWKESEGETFFSAISNMFKGLFKW